MPKKRLSPKETSDKRQWAYLAANPQSAYRQLFVKGTRIRARVLYGLFMSEEEPRTPAEIAKAYSLPVDAVKEAIAYCEGKPKEIEEDFRREEALMEATGMNDPNYKYSGKPKILTAQEIARLEKQ